jgi:hypothetical protein
VQFLFFMLFVITSYIHIFQRKKLKTKSYAAQYKDTGNRLDFVETITFMGGRLSYLTKYCTTNNFFMNSKTPAMPGDNYNVCFYRIKCFLYQYEDLAAHGNPEIPWKRMTSKRCSWHLTAKKEPVPEIFSALAHTVPGTICKSS